MTMTPNTAARDSNNFPTDVAREQFDNPVERGFEREMKKRLTYFESLRKSTRI